MSDAFDPYYLWLGIPPGEQPPDHYRLLGIAQFEADADVIRNAAEQRMRYLRTVTGPRAKRAQQLINEIVTAQRVLSEEEAREKYNTLITESPLARRRGVAPPAVSTPAFEPPSIDTLDTRSHRHRRGRGGGRKKDHTAENAKISNWLWGAIIGLSLGVLILTLMMVFSDNQAAKKEEDARTARERQKAKFEKQREANIDKRERNEQRPKNIPTAKSLKTSEEKSNPFSRALEKLATRTAEESKLQQAEQQRNPTAIEFLQSKGLVEGFNGKWELADLTAAYEEATNARSNNTPNRSGGNGDFETELTRQKRYYFNTLRDFYKRTNYQHHPASDPTAREAAAYLNSVGQRPFTNNTEILLFTLENGAPVQFQVPSDIPAISLADKVRRKVSSMSVPAIDSTEADEIAQKLLAQYAALRADAAVQAALETVGGTLAHAPRGIAKKTGKVAGGAGVIAAKGKAQAQKLGKVAKDVGKEFDFGGLKGLGRADRQDFGNTLEKMKKDPRLSDELREKLKYVGPRDIAAMSQKNFDLLMDDLSSGLKSEPSAADANFSPEKFTGSYEELAEQLATLEKETETTLVAFNKEAEAYLKKKKSLVKRIKAGETLYARRGRQQDAIQYPEEKTKFGEETDKLVTKPLNALKAQLKNLARPDTAPLEEKLQQAEQMIEQLKTTSEYAVQVVVVPAADPKSVDSLAEKIAKYRRGFEVQQTRMAR